MRVYRSECVPALKSIVIPVSIETIKKDAFNKCSSLTIYCNVDSRPDNWDDGWNVSSRPVYWKDQWSYVDGVPTPNN